MPPNARGPRPRSAGHPPGEARPNNSTPHGSRGGFVPPPAVSDFDFDVAHDIGTGRVMPGLEGPAHATRGRGPGRGPGRGIVFFDGGCGICHGLARFLVARDDRHAFDLAPLHGETHVRLVSPSLRDAAPDSVQVLTSDGALLVRSRAVAAILARLPAPHPIAAWLIALTPRPLADLVYDAIAKRRFSLAARPSTTCPLVPEHLRARFLP